MAERQRDVWLFETVTPWHAFWVWLGLIRGHRIQYLTIDRREEQRWSEAIAAGRMQPLVSPFVWSGKTHTRLREIVERLAAHCESAWAFRWLARVLPGQGLALSLRKSLAERTFHSLVIFLESDRLQRLRVSVKVFPARRPQELAPDLATGARRVPIAYRVALTLRACAAPVIALTVLAGSWVFRVVRSGCRLRSPIPMHWGVAQKAQSEPSSTRTEDHELLYDHNAFDPQAILHIFDERVVSQRRQSAFEAEHIPYVVAASLPLPLAYLIVRLIGMWLLRILLPLTLSSLVDRKARTCADAVLRIVRYAVINEVLLLYHKPRVYFTWDIYSLSNNVRTMIFERQDVRCSGYLHGELLYPHHAFQHVYVHLLFSPGPRYQAMFGEAWRGAGRIVTTGHLRTELILQRAVHPEEAFGSKKPPHGHLVVAYDTSYSPYDGYTDEVFGQFYRALHDLAETYPHVTVLLKRKYNESFPALEQVQPLLLAHPRIRITHDSNAYGLLALADSVIVLGWSTIGIEALSCRKVTTYFDPRGDGTEHFYRAYDPSLVCGSKEALRARYADILAGASLPATVWDRIVEDNSLYVEARPLSIIRAELSRELAK